jgi:hypothetical protein
VTSPINDGHAEILSVAATLVRRGNEADRLLGIRLKNANDGIKQALCHHLVVDKHLTMGGVIPVCRRCGKHNPRDKEGMGT